MDLNKSLEFFDPSKVRKQCHVIGCGSIGSNVAELLARYGIEHIALWDFDIVEPHNLANQIYTHNDIGKEKTKALSEKLIAINPDLKNTLEIKGAFTNQILNGFVFMCVDSVEVRKQILEAQKHNMIIEAVFDFRTSLLEGQSYLARWENQKERDSLMESLNFSHEEAVANTPVSACGFELSVAPVVRMTAELGIANFTNLINEQPTKHLIICQPYSFFLDAM